MPSPPDETELLSSPAILPDWTPSACVVARLHRGEGIPVSELARWFALDEDTIRGLVYRGESGVAVVE